MRYRNIRLLIFGVIEGLMPCPDYEDQYLQKRSFNAYSGNLDVTNFNVFSFRGEFIDFGVHFPGSWNNSKVLLSSKLKLGRLSDGNSPRGKAIIGQGIFVTKAGVTHGKILRSGKCVETAEIPMSALLAAVDYVLQRVISSKR